MEFIKHRSLDMWDTLPKSRYHISHYGGNVTVCIGDEWVRGEWYVVKEFDYESYREYGRAYVSAGYFKTFEEAQQYIVENLEKNPDPEPEPEPVLTHPIFDLDEVVDRMMTDSRFHDSIVGFF